jgi:Spy/CpxP family protein refolding chaperone
MRPRLKGGLLLLLAFLLGAASGVLGLRVYQLRTGHWEPSRNPARFQQIVLQRLTRELDLTADQEQQLQTILRETGQEFAKLRAEFGPKLESIRVRSQERIHAILNPAQQTKFDALAKRWERHHERESEREGKTPRAP